LDQPWRRGEREKPEEGRQNPEQGNCRKNAQKAQKVTMAEMHQRPANAMVLKACMIWRLPCVCFAPFELFCGKGLAA
jgi:hypothetical protein